MLALPVPAIDDKGFYLSESQAISIYLVNQYAKNDRLYPEDAQQRARVDQMLNFDASSLFPRFRDLYVMKKKKQDRNVLCRRNEIASIYSSQTLGKHFDK